MIGHVRAVAVVSDPPPLTPETIDRLAEEGRLAQEEYLRRTAGMERLTEDDLRCVVR